MNLSTVTRNVLLRHAASIVVVLALTNIAGVAVGGEEPGTRAEVGDPGLGGESPQGGEVGMRWAAVVEHDGGAGGKAAHQPVPHHPATRG